MRRSSDWDNISLSCRLNRLNKHSRWDKWQDKVSFCSLIRFNWRVPARVPLFSLGLKAPRSGPCGHSGRLSEVVLTHYRRREVRNSIYRYRKIHIDYRSTFSYRFISFISIIYGNTNYGTRLCKIWVEDEFRMHILYCTKPQASVYGYDSFSTNHCSAKEVSLTNMGKSITRIHYNLRYDHHQLMIWKLHKEQHICMHAWWDLYLLKKQ